MPWGTENATVNIQMDGGNYPVNATDNFAATVNRLASEKGWGSFRVYVAGVEINSPATAPTNFVGLTDVSITRYDKAGS